MSQRTLIPILMALGVVCVACGGGDDESPSSASGSPEAPGGADDDGAQDESDSAESGADAGGSIGAAIQIDPTTMPSPGDAEFDVEGSTFVFSAADAAGGPASSCSVDPAAIVVELQLSPGAMLVQANNADGNTWQGSVTISPQGSDRIYFSTPGFDGTFATQDNMAVYEGDFFWRTSDDPASRNDAGTGVVRMTC